MTPYGPPSALAYIIPVPNDIVGLIIGKGGETIRQLQLESGAKIQVAIKEVEATGMRNVFVEGPDDKYRKAKEMIDEIIRMHKQTNTPTVQVSVGETNPFVSSSNMNQLYKFEIPDKMVGLVIGKQTETLKQIALKSNTKIFIPQKNNQAAGMSPGEFNNLTRTVEVMGSEMEQQLAQDLILELIDNYHKGTYKNYKNHNNSPPADYNYPESKGQDQNYQQDYGRDQYGGSHGYNQGGSGNWQSQNNFYQQQPAGSDPYYQQQESMYNNFYQQYDSGYSGQQNQPYYPGSSKNQHKNYYQEKMDQFKTQTAQSQSPWIQNKYQQQTKQTSGNSIGTVYFDKTVPTDHEDNMNAALAAQYYMQNNHDSYSNYYNQ